MRIWPVLFLGVELSMQAKILYSQCLLGALLFRAIPASADVTLHFDNPNAFIMAPALQPLVFHSIPALVRINNIVGNTLNLQTPLLGSYLASHGFKAQVVRVPEYTQLTVPSGTSLVPPQAWDGTKGGVVAFAATGQVLLQGSIVADGMGFRGGAPNAAANNTCHATNLDDNSSPSLLGGKGEGSASFGLSGRGNYLNGAVWKR